MLRDTLDKGVRNHSYKLRSQVLADIFDMKQSPLDTNIYYIDCFTNVAWLTQQLFREWPGIRETSICQNCADSVTKSLTATQILDENLKFLSGNFIQDFCRIPRSNCYHCNGENSVEHSLVHIGKGYYNLNIIANRKFQGVHIFEIQMFFCFSGDIVTFEVFNIQEKNKLFALQDFAPILDNPVKPEEPLLIVGIVAYHGQGTVNMPGEPEPMGHYTAYVYRRGNTSWMEMDDISASCKYVRKEHKVVPRLIMYAKN